MSEKSKILIVDDEQDILDIISYNLGKAGYETSCCNNGADAIVTARKWVPNLILLDRMMPEKNGLQTLKELRQIDALDQTVIIFLTALSDEASEIEGLEHGADDYLGKPLKPELLVSRINAAMRRSKKDVETESILQFGELEINKYSFTVSYKGQDLGLAKKEFELLALLAGKPGRVFLRNEILQKVWGTEVIVGDRTIDVHIRKIRQKVGLDVITTVKGVGYKFEMNAE